MYAQHYRAFHKQQWSLKISCSLITNNGGELWGKT